MSDDEFAAIFEEHKNAVYQFAWRMTNSQSVAESMGEIPRRHLCKLTQRGKAP